jgi:ribosomal protein S27AE
MATTAGSEPWRRYRALRNGLYGWGGGGLVALLVAARALDVSGWPDALPVLATCAYLALWSAATIYFYFRLMFFRCPRCGSFFQAHGSARGGRSWLPRSQCAKCGLRTGQAP